MLTADPYPEVDIDLMKKALAAFYRAIQRNGNKPRWSGKAERAVSSALNKERFDIQYSCLKRCHAFRNLMNRKPESFRDFVNTGGTLDEALISAVALAPLRRDGIFRIRELRSVAVKCLLDRNVSL